MPRILLVLMLLVDMVAGDAASAPQHLAWSPDGEHVAVSDQGLGYVVIVTKGSTRMVPVGGAPAGIAWSPDGRRLWVSDGNGSACSCIDPLTGVVLRRIAPGRYLRGLAALPGNRAAVCVAGLDQIALLNGETGAIEATSSVGYQPEAVAATPDGRRLVVVPLLPRGAATDPAQAVVIAVLAADDGAHVTDIPLLPGATAARGVAITPDGRWALVTHAQAKANMPNTHVDLGWVSTNAVSILDLQTLRWHATILLDQVHAGSADPWGIAIAPDGSTAWVALSGIDAVARLDLGRILARTSGVDRTPPPAGWPAIWQRIAQDASARADLAWDLGALPFAGLLRILPLDGSGPRGMAVAPDGHVAVALHFDGSVRELDPTSGAHIATHRWAPARPADAARRGEILFHNANNSYQRWVSCATCHPDVRADGINWDLLNDGVGNPKNTRSLLLADRRAPVMSLGVRKDGPTAVRAGFRFIAYHEPTNEQVDDLLAFLRSQEPVASPYLTPAGALSETAARGKAIFEGKASCIDCHDGPTRSDQKLHDVGTIRNPLDAGKKVITPMLVELWRTAPYLHDGSAATLADVLAPHAKNTHGDTATLTEAERNDLIAYLMSL